MSILPDSSTQEIVKNANPYHYTNRWPAHDPDADDHPGYWAQLWNDMLRAHCEEIERDMRRAQREAEWWRARRAAVRSTITRVRARWAARITKAGTTR